MIFHIAGPHVYTLKISDQRMFNDFGDELDGLCIEPFRLILISRAVEPERREEVLYHELRHAWQFHVPPPQDPEQTAQLFATIAQQLRADIRAAGGIEVLETLDPEPVAMFLGRRAKLKDLTEQTTYRRMDQIICAGCGMMVRCGSITNSHVETMGNRCCIERWFDCACGCVQIWKEMCDEAGSPTGEFVSVPAPRLLRGREASEWRREHRLVGELVLVED